MNRLRRIRIAIGLLTACSALTALGGGIAMLLGVDEFPAEWLEGTPFDDYTIPALLLAIVVGGSSLFASITMFSGHRVGVPASMAAGLILVGYVVVELLMLRQVPPGPTVIEVVYIGVGSVVSGSALYLRSLSAGLELTRNG